MLSIIMRIGAVTAIGGLAAFAGYRILNNDGSNPADAASAPIATIDGVPANEEAVDFAEGQRADRVAVAETTDAPLPMAEGDAGQIRGMPKAKDEDGQDDEAETTDGDAADTDMADSDAADDVTETADAEPAEETAAPQNVTRNPVVADKKDTTDGFTTNPRRADKKDDGQYFTTNPKRVAKVDDGAFFTENTTATEFDPCLKADGTPYQGPGTALNPFAPVSPCLPKATAESYAAVFTQDEPAPDPDPEEYGQPQQPDYFAPDPALPPTQGGSDYRTI